MHHASPPPLRMLAPLTRTIPTAHSPPLHWVSFFVSLALTPFFIQTWVGPLGCLINGPLWTVCAQFLFYGVFPCSINKMHTERSTARLWKEGFVWFIIYAVTWSAFAAVPGQGCKPPRESTPRAVR